LAGELAGLHGVDLVQYPSGSAIGEIIRTALAEAGVSPRSRFEIREPGTARAMVSVGLAAAILPRSLAESPGPPVRIVALEPDLTWTPSLAWSATRRTAPALAAFLDFVIEHPELAGLAGQEHASQ
jgi:DNA-binding transcriptional LysR family regulator